MKTEVILAIIDRHKIEYNLADHIARELVEIEKISKELNDLASERLKRQNEWTMAQKAIEEAERIVRSRCKHWTRTRHRNKSGGTDSVICDQCGKEL